ncbi:unnamed protein product [Rotaria sordida]|uniref:Tetraspanin n=1 Tax=Rotaria sordida TaxID=392033 RepID=A0A814L2Q7_9BILA|nr:unnamed protein product [Rotaria sordida]CAF1046482.1 unnamed protein product [Rotaria sordida]CAF1060291.1 unnamed protein product [Rotaria sordida]
MGHGGMSCGMKTMRFIIVVFNLIFFLIGLALLALGIYVVVDPSLKKIKEILPINSNPGVEKGLSYLEVIAIVIIVLGSILLIMGFLGCCGAMKQVKIFLIIYAIIVGIIILFEIAITIYFVAFKSKFRETFTPKLKEAIRNTYEGPFGLQSNSALPKPSAISIAWDFIMYNFKCCGVDSKFDFINTTKWNKTNPWASTMGNGYKNFTYPITCCNISNVFTEDWNNLPFDKLQSVAYCAVNGTHINEMGCFDKFLNLIDTAKTWIIVGAVIILVIELTAFIVALALCCRTKKGSKYRQ